MSGPDIFLSYNREDAGVAKRYADAFAAEGLEVWWDATLRSGEAYDEVTEAALRGAKAVVVLWSPRSVVSRWVRAEATIALRANTLTPATIESCDKPVMFELTQTADLTHWQGEPDDPAWRAFLSDVLRMVGRDTAQKAAPVAASHQSAVGGVPFVAVLPVAHRDGENCGLFAEDLGEDITRELAQNSLFQVIGAGIMSAGRRTAIDHRMLGQELGASYLIEGKLQSSGDKLRLTMQLIDSATGGMLHSARYSRSPAEIETTPEELAVAVASEFGEQVTLFEAKRAMDRRGQLTGWDHVMRAIACMERMSMDGIRMAREEAREAVSVAPDLGLAHAILARTTRLVSSLYWLEFDEAQRREIHDETERAMLLDGNNPVVLHFVAGAYANLRDGEACLRLARRAVELAPNSPRAQFSLGQAFVVADRPGDAIAPFELQLRLAPHDLNRSHGLMHLGVCLCLEDRLEEAVFILDQMLALHPDSLMTHQWRVVALVKLGRENAARSAMNRLREIPPETTLEQHLELLAMMFPNRSGEAATIFRRLWEECENKP